MSFLARIDARKFATQRNEYEARALSKVLDALVDGRPDAAAEWAVRRLVAVEDADRTGDWRIAPIIGFDDDDLGSEPLRQNLEKAAVRRSKLYGEGKRPSGAAAGGNGGSRRSRGGKRIKRKGRGGSRGGAAASPQ